MFYYLFFSNGFSAVLTFICCTLMQTKDLKGISIDLLIPGMMVDARVQSTLENGIMLSFLTYFTGTVSLLLSIRKVYYNRWIGQGLAMATIFLYFYPLGYALILPIHPIFLYFIFVLQVDMFHLQSTFPTSNWKDDYAKNKKVRIRSLPSTDLDTFSSVDFHSIDFSLNPSVLLFSTQVQY